VTCSSNVNYESAVVPYSLDAVQALHAYWQLPYAYVPSLGGSPDISMTFSPLLNDEHWKGELALTGFQSQRVEFADQVSHL